MKNLIINNTSRTKKGIDPIHCSNNLINSFLDQLIAFTCFNKNKITLDKVYSRTPFKTNNLFITRIKNIQHSSLIFPIAELQIPVSNSFPDYLINEIFIRCIQKASNIISELFTELTNKTINQNNLIKIKRLCGLFELKCKKVLLTHYAVDIDSVCLSLHFSSIKLYVSSKSAFESLFWDNVNKIKPSNIEEPVVFLNIF